MNCPDGRRLVTGRFTMLGAMPSWSESNPPPETLATPAGAAATAVERVRRLLEQLVVGHAHDAKQPCSKP
jgi:hypothetical protein